MRVIGVGTTRGYAVPGPLVLETKASFLVRHYLSRSMVRDRFTRRFSRCLRLPVLTSLDDLASRSLASLDFYQNGSQRFMKQLRLAGSAIAISRAPVSRFARRFSRSSRLPVLTSLDDLASRSLASLDITMDSPHNLVPRLLASLGDNGDRWTPHIPITLVDARAL